MSMTSGEDLGKSELFQKVARMLLPLAEEAARDGLSLKEFETGLLGGLLSTGKRVVDQFLSAQGKGDLGRTIARPHDNDGSKSGGSKNDDQDSAHAQLHRSPKAVTRQLRTIFGEHEFLAYVYREREDRRSPIVRRPVDEQLGISPDRYSPLLQEYSMLFCLEQSFHSAVSGFEKVFRQRLSVDTLEKVSQKMGRAAEEFLQQLEAPKKKEEGRILVLTADGKGIPMVKADASRLRAFETEASLRPGNRRMATIAAVYSVDPYYRTAEEIVNALFRDEPQHSSSDSDRPRPQHKRLIAMLPGTRPDLGDEVIRGSILALTWAAQEVSKRRRKKQLLVRLMDGQHSLWSDANACLSDIDQANAIDILDLLHVAGYMGKAAKELCGAKAEQERFLRDRLLRILKGEVHAVIRGLRRMASLQKLPAEKRVDVDKACHYFETHADRMKYDEYLAAGLPIATGVIEGACRHLVKDRLERTGMRWSAAGAQGMLNLRAVKASNLWDEFQSQFHNTPNLKA